MAERNERDTHTAARARDDWSEATLQEMEDRLDAIGPPWGNPKLREFPSVAEGFWIAYEALERIQRLGAVTDKSLVRIARYEKALRTIAAGGSKSLARRALEDV